MKNFTHQILAASASLLFVVTAQAATLTVTNEDNGVSNVGAHGTFYWALTNCQPGDTIEFNLPGPSSTVHYLKEPENGFPLIYNKHRITINGYSQPGSLANTNPITGSNSAQIKVVIDGRSGYARSMCYAYYNGTLDQTPRATDGSQYTTSDPPINNSAMVGEAANSGFDPGYYALLGVYRSTNVTIKGVAFLSDALLDAVGAGPYPGFVVCIAVARDYGLDTGVHDALEYPLGESRGLHVAGCWFGVDPGDPTPGGVVWSAVAINAPRHKGDDGPLPAGTGAQRPQLPNLGLTIGVAAGSADPRAEFNVFVGSGFICSAEPLRLRISGNFFDFMPDGVTPYDVSATPNIKDIWGAQSGVRMEFGRYGEIFASSPTEGKPMVFGTDGDGVNDADEGNLWGPIGGAPGLAGSSGFYDRVPALIQYYRSGSNVFLIAGNRWGIGNDGTIWTNTAFLMSSVYLDGVSDGNSKFFIGSDFATNRNAATIAAQANYFYNNLPLSIFGDPPTGSPLPFFDMERPHSDNLAEFPSTNACLSLRGNVMAGNGLAPYNYAANYLGSRLPALTNFYGVYLDTNSPSGIIPTLNPAYNVFPHLAGTCAPGIGYFTNVIIDVYQLDPYGWTNGKAFALPELIVGGVTNGFPQGKLYLGSFPVANTGNFDITLPQSANSNGMVTVTANYSVSPAGTPLARTVTSEFANPIYMLASPTLTVTKSGGDAIVSWDAATYGMFKVQTNASVNSPGTWGDFTPGLVSPPVSVPISTSTLFIRAKNP